MSRIQRPSAASGSASPPEVTVIVQCYNHGKYVARAIESVAAQTYERVKVMVVDDASVDDTVAQAEAALDRVGLEARFTRHITNRGQCATLNEMLAQVDTEYMVVVSGDDWSEPNRIEACVRALESFGSEYGAVYTDIFLAEEDGTVRPETQNGGREMPSGDLMETMIKKCPVAAPGVFLRTDAVRAVGGYDESLPVEDFDLWLRLAAEYKIGYIAEPLSTWRIVPGSLFDRVGLSYFRASRLHSLPKHLGRSKELDRLILKRMTTNARWLYLEGVDPKELEPAFKVVARHRPGIRPAAWWLASKASVPRGWITAVSKMLGRRGNLHADRTRWTADETSKA